MSTRQTDKVWQQVNVNGQEKLLLLAIADISNHEGDNIHPSDDYLVWLTGIPKRTVKYYKARWKDMGVLVVVENEKGGRGNYVHYKLNLELFTKKSAWIGKGAIAAPFRKIQQQTNGARKDAMATPFENDKGCNGQPERVQPAARKGAMADTKGCNSAQRNKEEPLENRKGTKSGTGSEPTDRRLSQSQRDSWDLRRWQDAMRLSDPQPGAHIGDPNAHWRSRAKEAAFEAGLSPERIVELLRQHFPEDSNINLLYQQKPLFGETA